MGTRTNLSKWESALTAYSWTDDSDDEDDDDKTPQTVELPEPARKHMRKMAKENQDLKKQLADFAAAQRKTSVSDVLKAKGYNPLIADLIPSTVETSEEALGKWLDERAAIFAKVQTDDSTPPPDGDDGGLPPEMTAAFNAMGNVASNAQPAGKQADILAQLNSPTLTRDQLDAIMRAGGAKF